MAGQATHPHLEEEEAEEALSLCDLLLEDHDSSVTTPPPQSSSDLFEFFVGDSKMCPAEDIILRGKLVPFRNHRSPPPPVAAAKAEKSQSALRKRSESLSDLPISRSNSNSKAKAMMRNSRSLDCRKLQRSPTPEIDKKASPSTKPRWYLLMFGAVKLPPEMELRDIKSRQFRRSPSALFPPAEPNNSRNSWGLLRALSCKDHTSVSATTPFNRMSLV